MTTSPFIATIPLYVEPLADGRFSLKSTMAPTQLSALLFYRYSPSFFGLTTTVEKHTLLVEAHELLDALSPSYRNPLVRIDSDINAIIPYWSDAKLFQHATLRDGALHFALPHGELLATAATAALAAHHITLEQVPKLLPYLQDGGWPLQTSRSADGVQISVRLSEPAPDSELWTLETVLHTATSSHWTPAISKRALSVAATLPKKWQHIASDLTAEVKQIYQLLGQPVADRFLYMSLTEQQVQQFLRDDVTTLQAFGFDVILPAWLKSLTTTKMRVALSASTNRKTVASLEDIVTFDWQVALGDNVLAPADFLQIVEGEREFIRIGNEWFRVDATWVTQIKAIIDRAEQQEVTVRDLLLNDVSEELVPFEDDAIDPLVTFELKQSLQQLVMQLRDKEKIPTYAKPTHLQTELRAYQQQGYEWLTFMREQKLGACLADDMGLGKTVQLIAYLLHLYDTCEESAPSLIVCPTSVLGNWQKELERFAPHLHVHTHYTGSRLRHDDFTTENKQVILTTYGTVTQDIGFLQEVTWASVVLDEAQNIKNMQTQQSRAIRKLRGAHHIALTGTPVENRLAELWAIFDFIQRGYLGTYTSFTRNYSIPIEREEDDKATQKLRLKIQPFLLRRTKQDKALQLNLPDKQEMKEYCPLTTEQAALYEAYVKETAASLEDVSGLEKKGKILVMLNKLKQLCNHPSIYLKEPLTDATHLVNRSVKVERIIDMAASIAASGEQCLIFTQYVAMGNLLQYCLAELHDIEAPFLTGSTTKAGRDRLVQQFQDGAFPVFLLSLKAGGTGLNLTAATHVLHADRWWNPAVENQATDRAYRIGQKNFVQVHKFITIGTLEEKIDVLLTEKSALSQELIQSSKWLTELSDDELQQLMTLE